MCVCTHVSMCVCVCVCAEAHAQMCIDIFFVDIQVRIDIHGENSIWVPASPPSRTCVRPLPREEAKRAGKTP